MIDCQPAAASGANEEVDVLIAGAGPVGLVLATELARRGVAVHIIDELAAPTTESRAIVVHSRSLDHLQALGALDALMFHSIRALGMQMHSGDTTLATVSFESINAVRRYSAALAQTDTEAVLAARLAELGAHVRRSTAITGYRQVEDGVDIELVGADGTRRDVRARFLVGADGARSTVRHQMGQKLEGSFVGEDFLLGDVDGEHDYDRARFHTFFAPGEATGLLFPLPGDRVRVFAQLPSGTDPNRPATVDWLQQALDERGMRLRITASHWLTRVVLKHGQVPQYRNGRVFLAGDAAHIHSPAGGLGMNTGIQDAVNLAWKLATALTGGDHSALLDTYHAERHPVAADVIAFTTALSRVGTISDPVGQRARNVLMHLGLELPGASDRVAARIEQQNVNYRSSPIVSGPGHTLKPGDYLYLPDTDVARALADHPGHLVIKLPPTAADAASLPDWAAELRIAETDADLLRQHSGLHHGGVVIVRPDGYVGHIGVDPDSALSTYARLIGIAS